jgi:signal transduction histidine kinase
MNPKHWRLLLVEDLPIYIGIIKRLLQDAGIHLDIAQTLAEGLQKAMNFQYDAVLLDLGLPDSHGFETFSKFKSACSSMPIIIFSGTDDEKIAIQALQSGAQDYLVKGTYLTSDKGGSLLLTRSIAYAIERYQIQLELIKERSLLEQRVNERTKELQEINDRLRNLASWLVNAQEDERKRISMELHDEAGQFLTALKLSLDLVQKDLDGIPGTIAAQIQEANQLTETIMTRLRNLAHDLRPPAIDAVGLDQALQDHCQKVSRQTGISVKYTGSPSVNIPNYVQLSLYRVVQEALTNVVKHAKATCAEVTLAIDAESITLWVKDNGCGFHMPDTISPTAMGGIGLLGIHDRIEAIGGSLTLQTRPGTGTHLQVQVPLWEQA